MIEEFGSDNAGQAVTSWLEANYVAVGRVQQTLEEMRTMGQLDFATLSVAAQEIRRIARN